MISSDHIKENTPKPPVGAILVVGGGISGMQSALDLANSGFKVYLVESSPAIGGKMAQLDKTFPTNDCAMCIVSPKLVELGRHKNVELMTWSTVTDIQGEMGDFAVTIKKSPRYVDADKCTGCGACEINCPVTHSPYFPTEEEGKKKKRSKNKATLAYQGEIEGKSPLGWSYAVDTEKCKKCGACFRNCPVAAIRWEKGQLAEIDQDLCIRCGMCFNSCLPKFGAITISDVPEMARGMGAALVTRSRSIREELGEAEDRDCLRCGICAMMCTKVMGTGALKLTKDGIEVGRDICRACGACVSTCPVSFLDINELCEQPPRPLLSEFNERQSGRKPIYIKYPQAVPRVPVIDEETCVRLNTGECGTCKSMCDAGAIEYSHEEEEVEIHVGSVILSPGYEVFDAEKRAEFGYGLYPNVVTSLEFERLLSASGPTSGHVVRPSDDTAPKKVAWIQCVGSRDHSCDRDYCSSVCCMYATKEALIAKEHDGNIEPTIFYIDLRAFGKGFDDYAERAKDHHGVRFVRSMVSRVYEDPNSHNLELRYYDEAGEFVSEDFDMVVLSVGLQISDSTRRFAEKLHINLDRYGFAETGTFEPLATNRRGIFVSGVFNGPKDIPETVSEASAAACNAAASLAESRGTLISEETFPVERSVDGEDLRIGVFICHCGINIASVVDVARVTEVALTLPGVVYAEHPLYTCSQDSQEHMREVIEEHKLNRLVVAACSPRTHEPLFQETMRQTGMNKYLFDMANIRDQCSWVHQNDKKRATEKAHRLVRMAVANASHAKALEEYEFEVNRNLLVIGGGPAGITAALEAARQGFKVFLVEQEPELGGRIRFIRRTVDGKDTGRYLSNLISQVEEQPLVKIFKNSIIVETHGYIGNFETEIMTPAGVSRSFKHGATIVATGGLEHRPELFGLGENERVMTQIDFEELLEEKTDLAEAFPHIVMMQCVGSRDQDHLNYCSRTCCNQAIKNALAFKRKFPEARVDVLYRDIRSYAHGELNYREARLVGVNFIRFDPQSNIPDVQFETEALTVSLMDPSIRRRVVLKPDLLVLSTGIKATECEELATMLRVPLNTHGFFIEAHAKLRPVDFASEGLFLAGCAHGPKSLSETIAQAQAAVARTVTILSKEKMRMSGVVSEVNPEHCAVCLTCVRACPFGVPFINSEHTAEINPALCQGCGICVAECPAKAITLGRYRDENILGKIEVYQIEG